MKNEKSSKAMIMKSKPSFKEKNDIGPVPDAKTKKTPYDASMFNADALGSEIATTSRYAKKGKGGMVDKGVFSHKDNMISPDANY